MKKILIKKILILGLIFTALGCSAEDTLDIDKSNREVALAELKGSWKVLPKTITTITDSFGSIPLPVIGHTVTIDTLEFSIGEVDFEYVDINIKKGWIIYKATYNTDVMYTAFGINEDGDMLTEFSEFKLNLADVGTTTDESYPLFLEKKQ